MSKKETIMLAYLQAEAKRNPEMRLADALSGAQALIEQLDLLSPSPATDEVDSAEANEEGATKKVESGLSAKAEETLSCLKALCDAPDADPVSAKTFAEAMEIDVSEAGKRLARLVQMKLADTYRRGRGVYYTPLDAEA